MQNDDLKLIKKVIKIFEKSKFSFVAGQIKFWTDDDDDDELTEIDTCAIFKNKMFVIECKSKKIKHKSVELRRKNTLMDAIKSNKITKIENKIGKKMTIKCLKLIDEVYFGYYLGDDTVYKNNVSYLKSKNILVWDNNAVKYFEKISETLGNLTRTEIMYREFLMEDNPESKYIPAIKFQQGSLLLHSFVLPASTLLKIAYVSRRGTSRDESYQRIINPQRFKSLTNFIKDSKNLLIVNPIIIAFDQKIYGDVTYNATQKLNFKNIACSAWIIDGQHRIFAFKDIDLNSNKYKKLDIDIPVVALEGSDILLQSETFLNINYYQKKIDSLLIYDLAASFKYPKNGLVWPSMLTFHLSKNGVLKGLIKTKEFGERKPLRTTNFVRTILDELLGYDPATDQYDGPLYDLANFNKNTKVDSKKNKDAFLIHSNMLQKYFSEVMSLTKKPNSDWRVEAHRRGFLTSSSIQAFMLVLATILRAERKKNINFKTILHPLKNVNFTHKKYTKYRAGYPAIQGYTKNLIELINDHTGKKYKYNSISQIRKRNTISRS